MTWLLRKLTSKKSRDAINRRLYITYTAKKPPSKAARRSLRQCAPPANFFARARNGTRVSSEKQNALAGQTAHSCGRRSTCSNRPKGSRGSTRGSGCP